MGSTLKYSPSLIYLPSVASAAFYRQIGVNEIREHLLPNYDEEL